MLVKSLILLRKPLINTSCIERTVGFPMLILACMNKSSCFFLGIESCSKLFLVQQTIVVSLKEVDPQQHLGSLFCFFGSNSIWVDLAFNSAECDLAGRASSPETRIPCLAVKLFVVPNFFYLSSLP